MKQQLVQHLLLSLLLSLVTVAMSAVDSQIWIDPQNAARLAYGLNSFTYDVNLASLAQQHTDKCVYGFPDRTALGTAYTQLTGLTAPSFGMNLGSATPGFSRPSWLDQKTNWVCLSNTCTTGSCGGFTQVIWENSLRMGCALSSCGNQQISLCLYSPAGNFNGQHPFGSETWRCSSVIAPTTPVSTPTAVIVTTPVSTPTSVIVPTPVSTPTAVIVPTPSPVSNTIDFAVWVTPQNAARQSYGLNPFVYDQNLATLAQRHTDKCVSGFPDRSALATDYTALTSQTAPSFGMNIGSATSGFSRPLWLDQKSSWTCISNTCNPVGSCGGYTQVIWKSSINMGCAISKCGSNERFLCLYTPAGNIINQHPFGTETSRCTATGTVGSSSLSTEASTSTSFSSSSETSTTHSSRGRGRGRGRGAAKANKF